MRLGFSNVISINDFLNTVDVFAFKVGKVSLIFKTSSVLLIVFFDA